MIKKKTQQKHTHTHKSDIEMFLSHTKMIHFLHLCHFYFLPFICSSVIRLRPAFGRADNRRSVNPKQRSRETAPSACSGVISPSHQYPEEGGTEVWNQCLRPSGNGKSIRDRRWAVDEEGRERLGTEGKRRRTSSQRSRPKGVVRLLIHQLLPRWPLFRTRSRSPVPTAPGRCSYNNDDIIGGGCD